MTECLVDGCTARAAVNGAGECPAHHDVEVSTVCQSPGCGRFVEHHECEDGTWCPDDHATHCRSAACWEG